VCCGPTLNSLRNILFLFTITAAICAASPAGRVAKTIDRDWTFQYFPAENPDLTPASPHYDDSRWPAVAVPHTWSVYETTGEVHPFIKTATERDDSYWWFGWGWYRKHVVIGNEYASRLVSLEFDAVQKYSKIFVNGKLAGEHKGGYNSFTLDITPYVQFGKENLIAVLVSNRRDDPYGAIPPMTAGNWNVYGGISRDVRLVIKDRLHFPYQGSADYEGGTFVTTPKVSAENAEVRVRTWVRNDYPAARECVLVTTLLDRDGKAVQRLESKASIAPGTAHEFEQTTSVARPRLWSPGDPYVYRVRSEIGTDAIESPMGFRWFSWNKEEHKLYVNGKYIRLIGTNRHEEYPWLGTAVPKWMHERDLDDIRHNLSDNFQRTVHYPNDPYVYDLSDRLGIITVEELPNDKDIAFGRDIQLQNAREMIRRDRNHPCIFFWSMGNETDHPADSKWGHDEDPSRIIHLRRGTNGGDYVQTDNDDLGFENLLRCTVRGWHDGDRDFNDKGHPKNSQVTGTEEWQHDMNRDEIAHRVGDNIVTWLYADHGCDRKYLFSPMLYINPKGWVDAYRNPKYMYYLWEANFSPKPVLFIEPHLWREQYVGQKKDIIVDSNADSVTLMVNGRAIGTLNPTAENAHSVTFKGVPVEQGILSADGVHNSKPLHHEVKMAGAPARILLTASAPSIPTGRNGIATLSANIVDANGVHVIGANPDLHWKVEGPATLLTPAVYHTDTLKNASYEGEWYIDTPVGSVLRSGTSAGTITVTVEAQGLAAGRVTIQAVAPPDDSVTGISEPALRDDGRVHVTRDTSVKPKVFSARSHKLTELTQDYDLPPTAAKDYRAAITTFIQQRNIDVDTSTSEFRAMVDHLTTSLQRTNGHLIADDYNFLVRQFNEARKKTGAK
jgi:beta-galactosidase